MSEVRLYRNNRRYKTTIKVILEISASMLFHDEYIVFFFFAFIGLPIEMQMCE